MTDIGAPEQLSSSSSPQNMEEPTRVQPKKPSETTLRESVQQIVGRLCLATIPLAGTTTDLMAIQQSTAIEIPGSVAADRMEKATGIRIAIDKAGQEQAAPITQTTNLNFGFTSEGIKFALNQSTDSGNTLILSTLYPNGKVLNVWKVADGRTYRCITTINGKLITDDESEIQSIINQSQTNAQQQTEQQAGVNESENTHSDPAKNSAAITSPILEYNPNSYYIVPPGTQIYKEDGKPAYIEFRNLEVSGIKIVYLGGLKFLNRFFGKPFLQFTTASGIKLYADTRANIKPIIDSVNTANLSATNPASENIVSTPSTQQAIPGQSESENTETRNLTINIPWLPQTVKRWEPLILQAAEKHGVDPEFVALIMLVESGGWNSAVSNAGAGGLMQVMPGTAQDIADRRGISKGDMSDAATNIDFGTWYLAQQLRNFGIPDDPGWTNSVVRAAMAYNGGPSGAVLRTNSKTLQSGGQCGLTYSQESQRYGCWLKGLWNERHGLTSSTFDAWSKAGGNYLLQKAQEE